MRKITYTDNGTDHTVQVENTTHRHQCLQVILSTIPDLTGQESAYVWCQYLKAVDKSFAKKLDEPVLVGIKVDGSLLP